MKSRFHKIGYVLTWSIGLLCASFPWIFGELFNWGSAPSNFDFVNDYAKSFSMYTKTYSFTLLLFYIDCIYGALYRSNKSQDVVVFLVCTLGILFFLFFFLSCNKYPAINAICFIMSWLILTFLKYYWTEERKSKELEVEIVTEN